VAEPLLHLLDVATGLEEQGSAGVPEGVEADRRALSRLAFDRDLGLEADADRRRRQDSAIDVAEQ